MKRLILLVAICFGNLAANAQCGAIDFYSTDTISCNPAFVQFHIINLPTGASVEWDFGNGTLAGNTSPKRLYDSAANYTIKLKVTLINNAVCEINKIDYIKVKPKPPINITWDKSKLCTGPDTITITDLSANIQSRDYIIAGTIFNNAPPVFQYLPDSSYGIKSLYVFSTDSFGCRNVRSYDSAFYQYWGFDSLALDLKYTPDTLLCGPMSLTFSRVIPVMQNHSFVSYQWSFESLTDTFTSVASNPNITLPEGVYTVKHSFTNFGGCNYSITKDEWITIYDSIDANISIDKASVCAGEDVTLTLTNSMGGEITWDFDSIPVIVKNQTANTITVSFSKIGNFGVKVIYKNNVCVTTKSFNNIISVKGPSAVFSLPFTRSCVLPKTFRAINKSDITGAGITQFAWEVKNQKTNTVIFTSNSQDSIVFPITDTAYYSIKLKATGATGCTDSLIMANAIGIDSLYPSFSIVPQPACKGQKITLTATTPEGTTGIKNTHYWEVYNKNSTTILFSGSTAPFIVTLPDTGFYSVYLKSSNAQGCSGSRLFKDTISVNAPKLNFTVNDSLPCRGYPINLYSNFPRQDFPTYNTQWVLQHTDTNLTVISSYNRDSQQFYFNHPGIYKVRFVYSSANNQCRDTVSAPFRIKVSGIRMSLFTPDPLTGCEPLNIAWKGIILGNYNFKNNNPNNYTWKAQNDMKAFTTFVPTTGLITAATYNRKGSHYTRLVVEHGSGCNDSFYSQNFIVGTTANFSFSSSVRCINTTTPINNYSLNASTFKWEVDSPGAVFISPNDTTRNPSLTVLKQGDFYITLYSIGPGGCKDTLKRLIRVIDPVPEFNSSDTVQFCAPVITTFKPVPVWYGSEYRWYFGDGDTFTTSKANPVSHVYSKNTDSTGINIRLVVTTPGCRDTMDKIGYVKVIGPIPEYDYNIKSGCEPLLVDFKNTSRNYSRFYFDYGDGAALDSTAFDNHKYRVMDKGLNVQCYKTKLVLVDNNGCFASFEHKDNVCVQKSPEPDFKTTDTIGCETYTSNLQNTSLYGVSFKWDFKGDGNFVTSPDFNPSASYTAGVYRPRLAAFNVNGCSDTTALNKLRIWVQPKPTSFFQPASDSICFNTPLQFYALPSTPNKIVSYRWDFGDPANLHDTSSNRDPKYNYISPLSKLVQLVVTDSNACKDTFVRFIHVIDTVPPPNTGLHFVTVDNNKDILGVWAMAKVNQFARYSFFLDETGYTKLYETTNRQDTSYLVNTGIDINAKRYCYTTTIGDTCGIISKFSPPHCTMSAKVEQAGSSKLLVNWIKYVGWDLDDFWGNIIYRSEDGGKFIPIDTVDNTTDSYLDINLCERTYCYYIEAVNKNKVWRSVSNIVCEKPEYIYPLDQITPRKATVINNSNILVQWTPYFSMPNLGHYKISRVRHIDNTSIEDYDTTTSLSYIDKNVDVNSSAYSYYISPVDLCGYAAPKSSESKSILLSNKIHNYRAYLTWNKYSEWSDGVAKYVVEEQNEFGDFVFRKELPADSSSYIFDGINVVENRDVCLRVYAVRNGNIDTSNSNISCSIPESQIYIPNAFSPNNDGINDIFKPTAIYITKTTSNHLYTFEMEIYDRWGNKLFLTNDLDIGWDGTFSNIPCPDGVYLYKIRAVGLDGKPYDFKGTLHLVR
ncbi:MAG: PKD domain-containing protein [Bacteroidia bacterium]|nr:PKD domain-containing protein [Bacteroidia bacterium]